MAMFDTARSPWRQGRETALEPVRLGIFMEHDLSWRIVPASIFRSLNCRDPHELPMQIVHPNDFDGRTKPIGRSDPARAPPAGGDVPSCADLLPRRSADCLLDSRPCTRHEGEGGQSRNPE
ncbi:MAG: hypothetical protein IOC63_11270 [Methylobacterium sp.]|nr:hypothetical protein [Methylobacterium sp.]